MATRELLSPAQRQRLTELPDPMDERLLARHHTLSEEDLRVIETRRRPETKLGFAVQLCYLRFAPCLGETSAKPFGVRGRPTQRNPDRLRRVY